nr:DNA repair protein [Ipomoea batatas]
MGNDKMMKKQSKLRQYIGAPKRFLSKARDFYVDSMVSLDGKLANNNMVLAISPQISQTLPENLGSNNKTSATDNLNIRDRNLGALCRSSTTTRRRSSKHGDDNKPSSSNGKKVRFEDHSITTFERSRSHAVTRRNA